MLTVPYTTQYLSQHFADDEFTTLAGYERRGGYRAARVALGMAPADVIQLIKDSGLQGRGGAGFSTGLKWSFMPTQTDQPKYLVCNADESEPGSFKDRILIERGSHQMLEGILIAAWATGSQLSGGSRTRRYASIDSRGVMFVMSTPFRPVSSATARGSRADGDSPSRPARGNSRIPV